MHKMLIFYLATKMSKTYYFLTYSSTIGLPMKFYVILTSWIFDV